MAWAMRGPLITTAALVLAAAAGTHPRLRGAELSRAAAFAPLPASHACRAAALERRTCAAHGRRRPALQQRQSSGGPAGQHAARTTQRPQLWLRAAEGEGWGWRDDSVEDGGARRALPSAMLWGAPAFPALPSWSALMTRVLR